VQERGKIVISALSICVCARRRLKSGSDLHFSVGR